MFCLAIEVG